MRRAELLEHLKQKREERRKRRNRWLLMLLILILILILLCLQDCNCEMAPAPSDPPLPAAMLPSDPPAVAPPPPLEGKLPRRNRPNYVVEPPEPATWLNAFRLQVGARAPRLATCFEGRTDPGVLKWTTFVEPHEGRVSEHVLEPMLASGELTRGEKACVVQVLSEPPYDLPTTEERATPTRVGMVIEF